MFLAKYGILVDILQSHRVAWLPWDSTQVYHQTAHAVIPLEEVWNRFASLLQVAKSTLHRAKQFKAGIYSLLQVHDNTVHKKEAIATVLAKERAAVQDRVKVEVCYQLCRAILSGLARASFYRVSRARAGSAGNSQRA